MKILGKTALVVLWILCASAAPVSRPYQFNHENVLGTSFELKVFATAETIAEQTEQVALREIDRLNGIFSTYVADSEVSRWLKTHGTEQPLSPELFEVLALWDHWRTKTNGALNPTAAVAINLWKNSTREGKRPDEKALSKAVASMTQPQWILNPQRLTAVHIGDQPLVLNSFVKSYILAKVADKVMQTPGVHGTVVNIGGDIVVRGNHQEKIGVADPAAHAENDHVRTVIQLQRQAIATSGNYRRGFRVGDQWYSHIVDARTATPVSGIVSATVVADQATDAGALATAFNILRPAESAALAATIPGTQYLIITQTGEELMSPGWKNFVLKNEIEETWRKNSSAEDRFEVTVDLELARFEGRFRRPFVAVWVENKKKQSVRTLAVWFNKPRWLPDLKRWFGKNQSTAQDYASLGSISSATRAAGKYTLVWDGLDDAGQAAPAGTYTLYIEAAREHGTYQLLKQDIEWNGKPGHFDLPGGVEITTATVDLHAVSKN